MNIRRMQFILASVFLALGGFAPKVQATLVLELIPDNTGPYFGGESLTVDVWLHNEEPWYIHVWLVQLDFTDSDTELALSSTFTFDLSSTVAPQDFWVQADLPIPWTKNSLEYGCDECRLQLPEDGSLHVGSIAVLLPTDPGTYVLDAMNMDDPLYEHGALVWTDWDDRRAYRGDITGGVYNFEVIPEPGTLWLLFLGAATVTYTRRGTRRVVGVIATVGVAVSSSVAIAALPASIDSDLQTACSNRGFVVANKMQGDESSRPNAATEQVTTDTVTPATIQNGGERSLCGPDNRLPDDDVRSARVMPKGSLADYLYQHALAAPAVEFSVENLFPRAEI